MKLFFLLLCKSVDLLASLLLALDLELHEAYRVRYIVLFLDSDPFHDYTIRPNERGRYVHPLSWLVRYLRYLSMMSQRAERIEGVTTPRGMEPFVRGCSYHTGCLLDLVCLVRIQI